MEEKSVYQVIWTKRAKLHLQQIFEFISTDSFQNANKVVDDIVKATNEAITYPTKYAPDPFRLNNDGTFRSFVKHHYRITYHLDGNSIVVLWIRHAKRRPKSF